MREERAYEYGGVGLGDYAGGLVFDNHFDGGCVDPGIVDLGVGGGVGPQYFLLSSALRAGLENGGVALASIADVEVAEALGALGVVERVCVRVRGRKY